MEKTAGLLRERGIPFVQNCRLCEHSSFHIGGEAALAVFPTSDTQLCDALQILSPRVPFVVMGNATNVVFDDRGFAGAVLFTNRMRHAEVRGSVITADAGIGLRALALLAQQNSLTGLEFAHGIPGTLGGALVMNAGAFGGEICDVCLESRYFDTATKRIERIPSADHLWRTRGSIYADTPTRIILGATLSLKRGDPTKISARMEELSNRRRSTQPLEYPNAGSVFKRPPDDFAARLIDVCGLKGTRVGGAEVSVKHAGFIVNRGGATASDVRALVELIRERVLSQTGVRLECEIQFIDFE